MINDDGSPGRLPIIGTWDRPLARQGCRDEEVAIDPTGRTVVVVDDDESVRTVVGWQLEADGHRVVHACDGASALALISSLHPDVVVLDLSMPGIGGLDVLRQVRSGPAPDASVPIIVLSGRDGESDRIIGLDFGADDYLVKPFSPGELAARVRSVLRRASPTGSTLQHGSITMDPATRTVTVEDRPVALTAKEFDLLAHLIAHPRVVHSRAQLLARVWSSSAGWVSEATVTEHVHRLRIKIEDDASNPRWLRTVRGAGYQLGSP